MHEKSGIANMIHQSNDVANKSHESSDNLDTFDAEEMANADRSILLSKLNLGLKSGSVSSKQILSETISLLSEGCVIPTGFFLNAGEESQPELKTKLLSFGRLLCSAPSFSLYSHACFTYIS